MPKTLLSSLLLAYFRFFAKQQLCKNPRATIIGLTGSSGKTSLRLALVQILRARARVKHSLHANSQSGIPLNILGITPRTYSPLDWLRMILLAPLKLLTNHEQFDYYVVEMGIDSPTPPGNMATLLKIVTPHVGVILNANLAHSASFDHLVKDSSPARRKLKLTSLIAAEKMQLALALPPGGTAVINLDQAEFAPHLNQLKSRAITYGKSSKADLRITECQSTRAGFTLAFTYLGSTYRLSLRDIYPDIYAYTFASAIATGVALGIPPSVSIPRLSTYLSPPGRMRIFSGINHSTIIDSSYNASPTSMLTSLKLLKKIGSSHPKLAIIADMNELGLSAKEEHKNLADQIPLYCDEVILFGELTQKYTYPVLISRRFPVHHFTRMVDLIAYLRLHLARNAYVLVKGSQNQLLLERAVEAILQNPQDSSKLCRRGRYWDLVRAKTP